MAEEGCKFKVVLIGDSRVGKSNLLSRFTRGEFRTEWNSTTTAKFNYRSITVNRKVLNARIWDLPCKERCAPITMSYYRGAEGALLVYDVTRRVTFDNAKEWLRELRKHTDPNPVVMLVGNKTDLRNLRAVRTKDGERLAKKENALFMETSALNSDNVDNAFTELLTQIDRKLGLEVGDDTARNLGLEVGDDTATSSRTNQG